MAKTSRTVKAAAMLAGVAGMVALSGCTVGDVNVNQPPAPPPIEVNFALDKCQQIEPNLYKCPAIDKAICTPQFIRADVDCVHIGPKGSIFVQRGGAGGP